MKLITWIGLFGCGMLLALTGCATASVATNKPEATPPIPSDLRLDASSSIQAGYDLSPEVRTRVASVGLTGKRLEAYLAGRMKQIAMDMRNSGLFARADLNTPDYVVELRGMESLESAGFRLTVTMRVKETASGRIATFREYADWGTNWTGQAAARLAPKVMSALRLDFAADQRRYREEQASLRKLAENQNLPELIPGLDRSAAMASARNRAIIAARNKNLDAFLRDKKTEELSAFVTTIEQAVLDMNHASELLKDQAQTAASRGEDPLEYRSLAISYRERIELLKPVLVAVKDEIANRTR